MIFKIIGAIGILLITIGIITNIKKTENLFYIIGGACLLAYSLYVKDIIFIVLQIIFILAAVIAFFRNK